jgi:LysM repeat protein
VVKSGDTLPRIAKAHGLSVQAIKAANGLKSNRVVVGQKLKLPAGSKMAIASAARD